MIASLIMKKALTMLVLKVALAALRAYVRKSETKKDDALLAVVDACDTIYKKIKKGVFVFDDEIEAIKNNVDGVISIVIDKEKEKSDKNK